MVTIEFGVFRENHLPQIFYLYSRRLTISIYIVTIYIVFLGVIYLRLDSCCFTGRQHWPQNAIEKIVVRLNSEVENLIRQGVTHFLSGGERGFDQIAAALILSKKDLGYDVHLDFVLPCRNQDALWSEREKRLYRGLLSEADSIHYITEAFRPGCIKERDRYMIDHAGYCIYAMLHDRSGIWQTVQYARKRGLHLINIAG